MRVAAEVEAALFYTGGDPEAAYGHIEADQHNIRAAIDWSLASSKPNLGLRVAGGIWRFWQQRGHHAEARALLERLLTAPGADADPWSRAYGLTAYGGIAYWQGDHAAARKAYGEALELHRQSGDKQRLAFALYNFGWILAFNRELGQAQALLEEASSLFADQGDERGELIVGEAIALVAMIGGDLARARDVGEALLDDYSRLGMQFHYADTVGMLTTIYLEMGDASRARELLIEVAHVRASMGDVSWRPHLLQIAAGLAVAEGRPVDAGRLLGAIEGLRDRGERFFLPSDNIPFTNPEDATREQLSRQAFEAAFEEGRRWTVEKALEYALKAQHEPEP
jgi:non-specific serine/threonine protein kinase